MPVKKQSHSASGGAGGGGIRSRATAPLTVYHAGYPSQKIGPGGVAQYGSSIGDHVAGLDGGSKSTGYRGDPVVVGTRPSVALGNEVALNVGGGGPGTGRTVTGKSGTNAQYGPPEGKPKPQGRDILREYGSESPTSAARGKR
jgi:hypothetical protein